MDIKTQLTVSDNYGQKFKIAGPKTQIGSSSQCNIVLDEPGILNTHGEIRFDDNNWVLQDISGENSIGVNGENIQGPYQLKNNDVISIGSAILRVSIEDLQSAPISNGNEDTPSQNVVADLSSFRSSGDSSVTTNQSVINQNVTKKNCRACQQLIHPEAEICPHCGVRQMEPSIPTNRVGKKSRTTAALLAVFLGWIGAHKFYLNQTGPGLLYLLFSWTYLPGIVGFFEGISYFRMNDQQFAEKHADSGEIIH